jgi:carboxylate-amine ligase
VISANEDLEFCPSDSSSIGVEMEFQLVNTTTLNLTDGILPILELYPNNTNVKPEFIQNTVEVASDICYSLPELESDLNRLVSNLMKHTHKLGMSICGAGTHPFCGRLALITPLPRYLQMEQETGFLGCNQITFATHVHLGMGSGDEAVTIMRRLKPFLPVLIALSASSPFWRAHDTCFASYRHRILSASRSYGIPPSFQDWESFVHFYFTTHQAGAFETIHNIHWDIRPRPHLGTLEVRVMDAQSTVTDAVTLAGFVRALVFYLKQTPEKEQAKELPQALPWWLEKENHFQASRLGLEAKFIQNEQGIVRQLKDVCLDVINAIHDQAEALDQSDYFEHLCSMLEDGINYQRQRRIHQQSGSFKKVVAFLIDELNKEKAYSS